MCNPQLLDEIVNKAIPITFPGVKCAATIATETQKAKRRRVELTKAIVTLLENNQHARDTIEQGMEAGRY